MTFRAAVIAAAVVASASVAPATASAMQIFVRDPHDKTIIVECESGDTIEQVKQIIARVAGISPARQRLTFAGRELLDGRTLNDYSIHKESTIHLILREAPVIVRTRVDGGRLTVNGAAELPGTEVVLLIDEVQAATAVAAPNATWQARLDLAPGEYELVAALAVDPGDPALRSAAVPITVPAAGAPPAPVGPPSPTPPAGPRPGGPPAAGPGPAPVRAGTGPGAVPPTISALRVREACLDPRSLRVPREQRRRGHAFFTFRLSAPARVGYRLARLNRRGRPDKVVARGRRSLPDRRVRLGIAAMRHWHPLPAGAYRLRLQALDPANAVADTAAIRFRIRRGCRPRHGLADTELRGRSVTRKSAGHSAR